MEKIDLKKKYRHLYLPSAKKVSVVEVPEFNFVMLDGQLEPGQAPADSQVFQEALSALYGISFTLKFISKRREENPVDYTVMALEGLWWVASGAFDLSKDEPWYFTLMMMQPDHITEAMYQQALAELKEKKPNPALDSLRFERFREGLCIQMMHIGPYAEEPRTLAKMRAFAEENGYRYRGKHHEIYIGDPRRAKPEKLKTVLRHQVERIS
jgi:hypothetical protein